MPNCELTNMVMIRDKQNGKVLVQDRIKNWKGLSFPGGHIEDGESIFDSAVREVKEETGIDVQNLQSCGVIHWSNNKTYERCIVFLFRTEDYCGELISLCDEGRNFWVTIDELRNTPSENDTVKYLPMFLENKYGEAFGSWNKDEPYELIYK